MASQVKSFSTIDLDLYTLSKPEQQEDGTFLTYLVNKESKERGIYFKTPPLIVEEKPYERDGNTYVNLLLNQNDKDFYDFLIELENFALQETHDSCNEWFGKNLKMKVLENMLESVFSSNETSDAPMLCARFQSDRINIFNQNKQSLTKNSVCGCSTTSTLHVLGFYIFRKIF